MINFIKDLRAKHGKKKVTIIHFDNAGGNKSFGDLSKKEGLGIKFEYTSPGSPHQNVKCERKFTTLYGKVRSILNGTRLTPNLRCGLWTECVACEKWKKIFY